MSGRYGNAQRRTVPYIALWSTFIAYTCIASQRVAEGVGGEGVERGT